MSMVSITKPVLVRAKAETNLGGNRWTKAPLRMTGEFIFHAPADKVFDMVTDPTIIASWFPTVYDGHTNHNASETPGTWGQGSKHTCYTRGMGTLHETILHWDGPNNYAYNIKNWMMPLKDHAGVMTAKEISPGKTLFRWDQYYNLKGVAMRHVFPHIMATLINRGMSNLAKTLGGPGGKIDVL